MKNFLTREHSSLRKRTSRNHFGFKVKTMGFIACLALFFSCSSEENPVDPIDNTPRLNKSDSLAMVNIYKAIGPWGNWDLEDIQTWGGVAIAHDLDKNEYRIVGLEYYQGSFNGDFPDELRKLTELRRLAIIGGSLSGQIPEWIGELKHLYYLALGSNNMSGEIPESIGQLKKLKMLSLQYCQISGELPESLGDIDSLQYLHIGDTNKGGEIPKSLSKLKHLKQLIFINNKFSGTFPLEVAQEKLAIDCTNNNIEELPFEIWSHPSKPKPNLQGNRLSGTIPDSIKGLPKWEDCKGFVGRQQKGYGYSNYNN